MDSAERYIARWQGAGLIGEEAAGAIRAYEAAQARPAGQQWQVLVALILGAILLGAGVLLFVAAHWGDVSPSARLGMVLSMLVFFHGLGILSRERFSGFATAMHAVGTDRRAADPSVRWDHSQTRPPFPLQMGQELWVEVTVPETGPPRPIQLALSDARGFHPLQFQ